MYLYLKPRYYHSNCTCVSLCLFSSLPIELPLTLKLSRPMNDSTQDRIVASPQISPTTKHCLRCLEVRRAIPSDRGQYRPFLPSNMYILLLPAAVAPLGNTPNTHFRSCEAPTTHVFAPRHSLPQHHGRVDRYLSRLVNTGRVHDVEPLGSLSTL